MSNAPFSPQANPYVAPQHGMNPFPTPGKPFPTLCMVMFILSIFFCLIRIPMAAFGYLGWEQLAQAGHPLAPTAPFEIGASAAMALFGLPANIGLLMKQAWGLALGWVLVAAVAISMAVAVWQLMIIAQNADLPAQRAGMIVGASLAMFVRLGVLALYVAALAQFAKWKKSRAAAGF